MTDDHWKTAPISPTCEVMRAGKREMCGLPTSSAYPTHGGGWMALCHKHAAKHLEAISIEKLITKGEKFT